jgi:fermentation-respiration switch protein FrsA (DUF1100 family)
VNWIEDCVPEIPSRPSAEDFSEGARRRARRLRRGSLWRRAGAAVLVLAVLAYLAAVAALYTRQDQYLFPRDPTHPDLAAAGIPGLQEETVTTADGQRLVAWVLPPRDGKPVILYFPGQAGTIGRPGRLDRYRALAEDGEGLFVVSYRGYGGSTGTPSEEGLREDARAAYRAAVARFGDNIVLYGESLGTGVAVGLAAEEPVKGVILEAPYLSAAAVGAERYPWAPVRLLMRDQFRSDELIGKVAAPILILHGEKDVTVPFAQGEALFNLAKAPKRLVRFPDGRHGNLPDQGSIPQIITFLRDIAGPNPLPPAQTRVVREVAEPPQP